jgi:hypothetical protein
MKICGTITLPENFPWAPNILLALTKEIDKVCPEEGTFDTTDADYDIRTDDTNQRAMTS